MRHARAIAAAALTVGLAAGAPAAHAAPVTAAAPAQVQVAEKAAKAKTKISKDAPKKVKGGKTLKVKVKLKIKTDDGYKAYAGKTVGLGWLDPGETAVVDDAKTDEHGEATLKWKVDKDFVGEKLRFVAYYGGGSKAKESESDIFYVSITK